MADDKHLGQIVSELHSCFDKWGKIIEQWLAV